MSSIAEGQVDLSWWGLQDASWGLTLASHISLSRPTSPGHMNLSFSGGFPPPLHLTFLSKPGTPITSPMHRSGTPEFFVWEKEEEEEEQRRT